jgi:hypothetical protein
MNATMTLASIPCHAGTSVKGSLPR